MKIANVDLGDKPVSLAPMEDVTDPSFRLICREMGAASVYTEFVSAEALIRDIKSTTRKLDINDAERSRWQYRFTDASRRLWSRRRRSWNRLAPTSSTSISGCPVKKVAGKARERDAP